jgi:hypothetical protein
MVVTMGLNIIAWKSPAIGSVPYKISSFPPYLSTSSKVIRRDRQTD